MLKLILSDLLGVRVRRQIKDRKTDAIVNKLQLAAEVGQDYRI